MTFTSLDGLTFTNLDGLTVTLEDYQEKYVAYIRETMAIEIPLRGTVGYSELGMFTRTAHKAGIVAWANELLTFAYVLLEDGTIISGCFTIFDDGRFALS
jgi:hypothetical protein